MKRKVSVAMAVYNSEKYIEQQIDSILVQLSPEDELVISYNISDDSTFEIISDYESRESRVKIFVCDKRGVQHNFENAILNTTGDIIFLADHDDIWNKDKIKTVLNVFDTTNASVVMHSRIIVDRDLNYIRTINLESRDKRFLRNFVSNKFSGACMAFKRNIIKFSIPIPKKFVYHDVWIGLISSLMTNIEIINLPLNIHRRHENNASKDKHRFFAIIIIERSVLLFLLIIRAIKMVFYRDKYK